MRIAISAAAALLLGFAGIGAAPALAQRNDKVLVIYGNDVCPSSEGQEIVVCARKPESERYRIPSELRAGGVNNWRERAKSLEYAGASGTQSCSAAGTGGWTGCWSKLMRQAREERKQQQDSDTAVDNTIQSRGSVR